MSDTTRLDEKQQQALAEASEALEQSIALYMQQDYPACEPLLKKAVAIWEEITGIDSPDTVKASHNLANLYYVQARYGEAIEMYKRVLAAQEKQLGANHTDLLEPLHWLAESCFKDGRYDEAETNYCRALKAAEAKYGGQAPEYASALMELGFCLYFVGRYADAVPLIKQAQSVREAALGPHDESVAECTERLALTYAHNEEFDEDAGPLFQRSIEILLKTRGNADLWLCETRCRYACWLAEQGRTEEAEEVFVQMMSALEQMEDLSSSERWWMCYSYEQFLRESGRNDEANAIEARFSKNTAYDSWIGRDLNQLIATRGEDDPDVAAARYNLGNSRLFERDVEGAENYHQQALATRLKLFGEVHPDTVESLIALTRIKRVQHRPEEALELASRANRIAESMEDPDPEIHSRSCEIIGMLHDDAGRFEDAARYREQAYQILEQKLGTRTRETAEGLYRLAIFYSRPGHFERAAELLQALINIPGRDIDVSELERADYLEQYGGVLQSLGREEEAAQVRQQVKDIWAAEGEDRDDL